MSCTFSLLSVQQGRYAFGFVFRHMMSWTLFHSFCSILLNCIRSTRMESLITITQRFSFSIFRVCSLYAYWRHADNNRTQIDRFIFNFHYICCRQQAFIIISPFQASSSFPCFFLSLSRILSFWIWCCYTRTMANELYMIKNNTARVTFFTISRE